MATGGNTVQIILNIHIAHDGKIAHFAIGPTPAGLAQTSGAPRAPPVYITDTGDIVRRGVMPAVLPPSPAGSDASSDAGSASSDAVVAPIPGPLPPAELPPLLADGGFLPIPWPLPCRHILVSVCVNIMPDLGRPGPSLDRLSGNYVRTHVRSTASGRNGPGAGRSGRSLEGVCSRSIQLPAGHACGQQQAPQPPTMPPLRRGPDLTDRSPFRALVILHVDGASS